MFLHGRITHFRVILFFKKTAFGTIHRPCFDEVYKPDIICVFMEWPGCPATGRRTGYTAGGLIIY